MTKERKEKKKGSCLKTFLILLGIFLVIGAINSKTDKGSADNKVSQKTEDTSQANKSDDEGTTYNLGDVMDIDPKTLLADYEENEVRGDELYDGTVMRLTGTVKDIGKDLTERVYITFEAENPYSITSVQCFFTDDTQVKKVMELSEGDTVTVIGKCDGKFANVFIEDCIFE